MKRLLQRVWLELRLFGHAFLQREFEDPRVQAVARDLIAWRRSVT